jgi:hypothetical protein
LKKSCDLLLNVVAPLGLGTVVYFVQTNSFMRNYLSDGLWAYSLTSLVLIIWNRKPNLFWLTITFLCFPILEFLQEIELVKGTGDIIDITAYIFFAIFALILNKFQKHKSDKHE